MAMYDIKEPRALARAVILVHSEDEVIGALLEQKDIDRLRSIECEEMVTLARALLAAQQRL